MTLAEMLAREAIRYTVALYNKNGDSGDYENHRNVFLPDAEMVVQNGPPIQGIDAIIAAVSAGAVARKAFEGGNFQRHNLTTAMIEVISETEATATHYIMITSELGLDHTGTYKDHFVKRGDRWFIKRREATMEWARKDSRFNRWPGTPTLGQG